MAGSPHKILPKIVDKLLLRYNSSKASLPKVESVKRIKLTDPADSKSVIEYDPDYVIKRNLTKHTYFYIVFEVIDGQDDIKTMADIARILAKPEIKKAIFISVNPSKKLETERIVDCLLGCYKDILKRKKKKDVIDIVSKPWSDKYEKNEKMIMKEIQKFLPKL